MKEIALLTTLLFSVSLLSAQCDFTVKLYDDSGELDASNTTLCQGESYGLKAHIDSGCTPLEGYSWSTGEMVDSIGFTVDLATPDEFQVTITYDGGNEQTESIMLAISPELTATISDPGTVCTDESVDLMFTGTQNAIVTYELDGSEMTTDLDGSGVSTVTLGPITTTIMVELTEVELNGCVAMLERTLEITPKDPPSLTPIANVDACDVYEFPPIDGDNLTAAVSYFSEANGMGVSYDPGDEIMTSGTYYVYDSGGGCPAEVEFDVTINSTPVAQINTASDEICAEDEITISATATGDSPVYNWMLTDLGMSTGQELTDISWDMPGVKTVQLSVEEDGCSAMDEITITVKPKPDASNLRTSDGTEVNCSNVDNFQIEAPAGFSEYVWSTTGGNIIGSTTTATIQVDQAGLYEVTITEDGCSDVGEVTITEDFIEPSVMIDTDNTELDCDDTSTVLTAVAVTQGDANYLWSTTEINEVITVSEAGIFEVTVTDTDNGCTASSSVEVTNDSDLPEFTVDTDDPNRTITCGVTAIEIFADDLGNDFTYLWSSTDGSFVSSDLMNPSVTVDGGGTYTVTVTNVDNDCLNTGSVMIQENVVFPTINPSSNIGTITCNDEVATLNAGVSSSGLFSYAWEDENGNDVGDAAMIMVMDGGTYSVSVTDDDNDCVSSDFVSISIDQEIPLVTIEPTVETLTCMEDELASTLNATVTNANNVSYNWIPNQGNIEDPTVSTAGIYRLVVTNEDNGCPSAQESVEIMVDQDLPQNVVIGGTDDLLTCIVEEITLSVDPDIASGQAPDIEWNTGDMDVDQITITVPFSYVVTVTDPANGCSETSIPFEVDLNRATASIDQIPARETCEGTPVFMDVEVSDEGPLGVTYLWANAGLFQDNEVEDALFQEVNDISATITRDVMLTITRGDNGCPSSRSTTVTVFNNPEVEIAVDEQSGSSTLDQAICLGDQAVLGALASQGTGDYNYEWSNGSDNSSILVSPDVGGTSFGVSVTDDEGCEAEDMVQLTVHPLPNVQLTSDEDSGNNDDDDEICLDDEVTIFAVPSGTVGPYAYAWAWGNNTSTDSQLPGRRPSTNTTYEVTITDGRDCETTDMIEIIVQPLPELALSIDEDSGNFPDDNTICSEELFTLIAQNTGAGQGITNYTWNGDSNSSGEWTDFFVSENQTEIETLTVEAENSFGCLSIEEVNLTVEPLPSFLINDSGIDPAFSDGGTLLANPVMPNWDYSWSLSGTTTPNTIIGQFTSELTILDIPPGELIVTLDVTDEDTGCDNVDEITLDFIDNTMTNAAIDISENPPYCLGTAISIDDESSQFNSPSQEVNRQTWQFERNGNPASVTGTASGEPFSGSSVSRLLNTAGGVQPYMPYSLTNLQFSEPGTWTIRLVLENQQAGEFTVLDDAETTVEVLVLPEPTSLSVIDPRVCEGEDAMVRLTFADEAIYSVTYTFNGSPSITQSTGTSSQLIDITIPDLDDAGTYVFELEQLAVVNGCNNTFSTNNTVSVEVVTPPSISGDVLIVCDTETNQTYSVSFEWQNNAMAAPLVITAAPPANVPPQSSDENTGTYTSPQIPNETSTFFILEDGDGCTTTTELVSGQLGDCNACSTAINIGDPQEVSFCQGDSELTFDRDALFMGTGEENLVYIIHTGVLNPDTAVDTLFGFSASDTEVQIELDEMLGYELNRTYFITALLGNTNDENTIPSPEQDGCTQQEIIAEFIIYTLPEVSFLGADPVCFNADPVAINVNVEGVSENSDYTIAWSRDGGQVVSVELGGTGTGNLTTVNPGSVNTDGIIVFDISGIQEDSTGCETSYMNLTDTLVVNPLPVLTITGANFDTEDDIWETEACIGGELELSTTEGLATYSWTVDSEEESTTSTFRRDSITEEIVVNLTAEDENMCVNMTSILVEPLNIPVPMIEDNFPIICLGATGVRFDMFDSANPLDLAEVTWSGFEAWGTTNDLGGRDYTDGPLEKNQISLDLLTDVSPGVYSIIGTVTVASGDSMTFCAGIDLLEFTVTDQQAPPFLDIQYLPAGNVLIYPDAGFDCYQWGFSIYNEGGLEIEELLANGNTQAYAGGENFLTDCEARDYWVEVTNADCDTPGACTTRIYLGDSAFNPEGCGSLITSTEILEEDTPAVLIFPNPNNGQFQIAVQNLKPGRLRGRLFNAAGQIVGETDWDLTQPQAELPWYSLPHLPAGLYHLQLWDADGQQYSQQMIIQK